MRERPLTEFLSSEKTTERKENPARRKEVKGPWELPEGWRWVKLGEILTLQYGISKKLSEDNRGYPILRMNNITYEGKLDLSDLKFVKLSNKEFKKYRLEKGDILINRTNSKELVGKTAVFNVNGDFVFASYIIRGKLKKPSALPEFVAMFLNSPYMKAQFLEMARQAVQMANINARELSRILVPLPPLSEQKRIVAKLDELNKRIEEAKRLAREAREEAERLMASALYEVFSKAEEKDWEWVRLDTLFTIQQGASLSPKRREGKNPLPFLRTKNVKWGYVDISELDYMDFTPEEVEKLKLKPGDLLVLEGGEIGRTAIWRGELEVCLYQNHIHRLRRKSEEVLPEFYMYWMQAAYKVFSSYNNEGVRTAIPNLSKSRLASFKVPFPPLEEQKRIVAYLDSIHERAQRLVKLYEEREKELEKLFPAILDRAFRGEL